MDKKAIVNFLNSEGYKVKMSQISGIEKLGTTRGPNSAGVTLSDYKVETEHGAFIISEDLIPNKYGSTAFSTDKKLKLTSAMTTKSAFEEKEKHDESGEKTESEDM